MKKFFFTGINPENKSGVSWKTWKIERRGKVLKVYWGPVQIKNRRIIETADLQGRRWTFPTEEKAKSDEARRIREKTAKGYERTPHING